MQLNEKDLMVKAKSGDDYSFEILLSNYKNLVINICRRYFLVGGDVDDLIQEGMIALFKAVKTFDESKNASFYSYAKTLIERQIINEIKKANNKKNNALSDYVSLNNQGGIKSRNSEETFYIIDNDSNTPEELILNNETVKQIMFKIKEVLSSFELKVLELYLDAISYTEIAKILNKSNRSIDNALNRIKRKLQFLKQNH